MTDHQTLLAEYTRNGSDAAFRELVTRYVDLVFSTALRLVEGDTHRAEDVVQTVFVDLARVARTLPEDVKLGGWLHRDTCFVAATLMRGERRRQARERQAVEMNTLQNHSEADYSHVAPLLDEAINELEDADRTAILLRFFEQQDFRTVGQALGSNEDAARMRVTRALEKLEELLKRRGVTTSAASLGVVLAANAVQAAPVGLALTISTAAALAATTVATTATATAIKTIAMTTLQKNLIAAILAVVAGVGIYEARQASQFHDQVQALQQQRAPLAEQIQKLQSERDTASNSVVGLTEELATAKKNDAELLRLRGEVGALRAQLADARTATPLSKQPPLASADAYYNRAGTHYMNHDYEAQLEDLNKAIELDPNMAEAYFMRGNLYAHNLPKEKGGEEKALADYTRCLELKPNDASARWNRANGNAHLRRYDEAIADWTVYINGDTDFSLQLEGKTKSIAGAHFWRGRIFQANLRDYSSAIADYTEALQLNPNIEDAQRLRGECYEQLGEKEKAQQDFAIEPKRN